MIEQWPSRPHKTPEKTNQKKNNQLDELQQNIEHEAVKAEIQSKQAELKQEITQQSPDQQKQTEYATNEATQRQLIAYFDDIDQVVADDMIEEFDQMKQQYGFVGSIEQIISSIRQIQAKQREQKFIAKQEGNRLRPQSSTNELRKKLLLGAHVDQLTTLSTDNILGQQWDQSPLFDNIALIAELLRRQEELDEEKKKKLMKWLHDMMSFYLKNKILEVYEIRLNDDGSVTIVGKDADGNMTTVTIDKETIQQQWWWAINTILDGSEKHKVQRKLDIQNDTDSNSTMNLSTTSQKQWQKRQTTPMN